MYFFISAVPLSVDLWADVGKIGESFWSLLTHAVYTLGSKILVDGSYSAHRSRTAVLWRWAFCGSLFSEPIFIYSNPCVQRVINWFTSPSPTTTEPKVLVDQLAIIIYTTTHIWQKLCTQTMLAIETLAAFLIRCTHF